ncbi:hypothetical protein IF1G_03087 [Cordyceps javanica]|uniref:Uncharacterized protein n=1 Tax=Cordyceps javanica TaxID=43265 RepID=A0A545VB89_9HYPO|nr:hypothetical protein IF1G_03087 [Cordyceps javanica]
MSMRSGTQFPSISSGANKVAATWSIKVQSCFSTAMLPEVTAAPASGLRPRLERQDRILPQHVQGPVSSSHKLAFCFYIFCREERSALRNRGSQPGLKGGFDHRDSPTYFGWPRSSVSVEAY